MRPTIPSELTRFVELFNQGAFWDSHEVLEGPWRESDSDFYHGLILYASAFVHARRNNRHGIVAQLRKAERVLEPFAPAYLGIDVAGILERSRSVIGSVEPEADQPPEPWDGWIDFPRLAVDPGRIRGDEPELAPGSE